MTRALFNVFFLMIWGVSGYVLVYHLYKKIPGFFIVLLGVISFFITMLWLLIDFYYFHWYDNWAWLLEIRSLRGIEATFIFIGIFCAILQQNINKKIQFKDSFSRHNGIALLLVMVIVPYIKPVLYTVEPKWRENWVQGVCVQTTPYTCGPASTATILNYYGIRRTEHEISHATYFTRHGTEPWYLARYIRQCGLEAHFVSVPTEPADPPVPCIVGVRAGGKKGKGHFITLLGKTPTTFFVGDPAFGPTELRKEELFNTYYFVGFVIHVTKRNI